MKSMPKLNRLLAATPKHRVLTTNHDLMIIYVNIIIILLLFNNIVDCDECKDWIIDLCATHDRVIVEANEKVRLKFEM
jgi:hypothetical protein